MPAFGLLGIDFGYGFDNANPNLNEPNGWETHFVIGQNFKNIYQIFTLL